MGINIGSGEIDTINVGTLEANRVYIGADLAWQNYIPPVYEYLYVNEGFPPDVGMWNIQAPEAGYYPINVSWKSESTSQMVDSSVPSFLGMAGGVHGYYAQVDSASVSWEYRVVWLKITVGGIAVNWSQSSYTIQAEPVGNLSFTTNDQGYFINQMSYTGLGGAQLKILNIARYQSISINGVDNIIYNGSGLFHWHVRAVRADGLPIPTIILEPAVEFFQSITLTAPAGYMFSCATVCGVDGADVDWLYNFTPYVSSVSADGTEIVLEAITPLIAVHMDIVWIKWEG